MPIGKNSIKRVANNGYSNLATSAPDMENSEVAEEKKCEKCAPVAKKEPKAAPKRKPAAKKEKLVSPSVSVEVGCEDKDDRSYVSCGEDMPIYLL